VDAGGVVAAVVDAAVDAGWQECGGRVGGWVYCARDGAIRSNNK